MHTMHTMPTSGIGRLSRHLLAKQPSQKDTSSTPTGRPLVRSFGRIAIVGALALLLAGSMATPAGAMKRSQTVKIMNGLIGMCFANGGDPEVEESVANGGFSFACYWEDGSYSWNWWGYEDEGGDEGDAPVRGRSELRSAQAGEAVTADDAGTDAVDHGRQKAHKQHKHRNKAHADKHGHKHRR